RVLFRSLAGLVPLPPALSVRVGPLRRGSAGAVSDGGGSRGGRGRRIRRGSRLRRGPWFGRRPHLALLARAAPRTARGSAAPDRRLRSQPGGPCRSARRAMACGVGGGARCARARACGARRSLPSAHGRSGHRGGRTEMSDAAGPRPSHPHAGSAGAVPGDVASTGDVAPPDAALDAPDDALLVVRGLKKYYPIRKGLLGRVVDHVRAVDDISFWLRRGETLGLVGESGSGKTTTGRAILRLIEPTAGEAIFDGQDIFRMGDEALRRLRRRAQIVFQDPFGSLN